MKTISIINDLHNHTIDLLRNENLSEANKNIDLLCNLFTKALETTLKPSKSIIVKELYNSLKSFVFRFRNLDYYEESNRVCIRLIQVIYKPEFRKKLKESNSFFGYSYLEIEIIELVTQIIKSLSTKTTSNSIENSRILELLKELTRNSDKLYGTEMFRYIPQGFGYYFNLINEHIQLSNKEIDDLLNQLVDRLFSSVFEWYVKFPKIEEIKLRIFIKILIKISEQCILKDNRRTFNKIMLKYSEIIEDEYDIHSEHSSLFDLFINLNVTHLYFRFLQENITVQSSSDEAKKHDYNDWLNLLDNSEISYSSILEIFNQHIVNCWNTYSDAKRIISFIEFSYVKPGILFAPRMKYRLLDYYFFSTVNLLSDYSQITIKLNEEDFSKFSSFFKNKTFNINSERIKENINKFYAFTNLEKLSDEEFVRRANEFYKKIKKINE